MLQRRLHRSQEGIAQPAEQSLAEDARLPPGSGGGIGGTQGRADIRARHGVQHGCHRVGAVGSPARSRYGVERRQGVPRRPAAGGQHVGHIGVGHRQAGVGSHRPDMALQRIGGQQFEVQVLGAAADRRRHLVRLGRAEHEHHVGGWFLEGLQQGVLGARREHVHLVEHVHLGPARRAERHPADELANVVDLVVGGGVQLVQLVGRARGDGGARRTGAARLAVGEVLTIERLGQDAGGGCLPRAARPAEEVGVPHPVGTDSVAQCRHDVFLADDLAESRRPVAQVERLMHHRRRA